MTVKWNGLSIGIMQSVTSKETAEISQQKVFPGIRPSNHDFILRYRYRRTLTRKYVIGGILLALNVS